VRATKRDKEICKSKEGLSFSLRLIEFNKLTNCFIQSDAIYLFKYVKGGIND